MELKKNWHFLKLRVLYIQSISFIFHAGPVLRILDVYRHCSGKGVPVYSRKISAYILLLMRFL